MTDLGGFGLGVWALGCGPSALIGPERFVVGVTVCVQVVGFGLVTGILTLACCCFSTQCASLQTSSKVQYGCSCTTSDNSFRKPPRNRAITCSSSSSNP
ncbi:hypothetical protein HanRHA438_Chr11g0529971 [Helianthus annuus]|nr:hypothetical protein HanIR_Chr11g0557491 [Helianthus annuus]KAJ0872990.1 hypothetical protein HanRHA438_Chr11g0529971 [Helianthus annuus]